MDAFVQNEIGIGELFLPNGGHVALIIVQCGRVALYLWLLGIVAYFSFFCG
jgi:hypothetical protein